MDCNHHTMGAVKTLDCIDGRGIAGATMTTTMWGPGDDDVEAVGFARAGRQWLRLRRRRSKRRRWQWYELDGALRSKPDMYKLFFSKQCKCPNCGHARETSTHLNRCPDQGPSLLFKEGVAKLSTWMHQNDWYWPGTRILDRKKHSSEAPDLMPCWSRRAGSAPRMSGWRRVAKTWLGGLNSCMGRCSYKLRRYNNFTVCPPCHAG